MHILTFYIVIGFADANYTVSESVGTFQVDIQVFNPTDDQPLLLVIPVFVQTIDGTASKLVHRINNNIDAAVYSSWRK